MVERKILILLPGNRIFGAERALINLGLTLRELGCQVVFLIHQEWGKEVLAPALSKARFRWHPVPFGTIWGAGLLLRSPGLLLQNLFSLFSTTKSLRVLLARERFDSIIIGNTNFALYLLPALKGERMRVIYRHGDPPLNNNWWSRAITRRVFTRVTKHVANCHFLSKELRNFDASISPDVIYNYPVQLRGLRGGVANVGSEFWLLFVGQLSAHKGLDLVLDAFDALAPRHDQLRLHVVGRAPGVGNLIDYSETKRLKELGRKWSGRVRHTEFTDNPADAFLEASLHLCPSVWADPSPNVIFEAKHCGVPTIAFPNGGIPELIEHKVDGYLCENQTAGGLAEAIEYFLERPDALKNGRVKAYESLQTRFSYERYRRAWQNVVG